MANTAVIRGMKVSRDCITRQHYVLVAAILRDMALSGTMSEADVDCVADYFADSAQPIVPERLMVMSGSGDGKLDLGSSNVFSQFLTLLLAEKSGMSIAEGGKGMEELEKLTANLVKKFAQPVIEGESSAESDKTMDDAMKGC